MSHSYVGHIRAGRIQDDAVPVRVIEALAEATGRPRDWWLGASSEPSTPDDNELESTSTGDRRWEAYARRYWTFRAQASIARARGVPDAALATSANSSTFSMPGASSF
jgi:hypothetical protein